MLRHISTYLDLSAIFRAANMQHGDDGVSEHSENSAKSQPENEEADEAITEEVLH
jgi:hypothetical protein